MQPANLQVGRCRLGCPSCTFGGSSSKSSLIEDFETRFGSQWGRNRKVNRVLQIILQNLRILWIFTENWILRLHLSDFDDFSKFASQTRSRNQFPADSAKNAVSKNWHCPFFANQFEHFGTIFGKNPLRT